MVKQNKIENIIIGQNEQTERKEIKKWLKKQIQTQKPACPHNQEFHQNTNWKP